MAFCFRCGTPIPDGAAFCSSCGIRQQFQQSAPAAQPQPAPSAAPAAQPNYPPNQPMPQAQPVVPNPAVQPVMPVPQPIYPSAAPVGKVTKAGGSVLKWLIPLVAVLVIVGVVAYLYFGTNAFKSDEELIRERIQALEDAYNDGDWDAVLDCMDNQSRNMMEAYMGLMDGLMGDMGGLGMGISDLFGFAGAMGDYCSIEILDIQIEGDSALVAIVMTMEMYGNKQSEEATFLLVKEDGDWYIGNGGESIPVSDDIDSDYL